MLYSVLFKFQVLYSTSAFCIALNIASMYIALNLACVIYHSMYWMLYNTTGFQSEADPSLAS